MEYSEEQAEAARDLVRRMFEEEDISERVPEGVALSDVQEDVSAVSGEAEVLLEIGSPMPALRLRSGGLIPMSSTAAFGVDYPFRYRRPTWILRDLIYDARRVLRRHDSVEFITPLEGRSLCERLAAAFVASRLAAVQLFRRGQLFDGQSLPTLNMLNLLGGRRIATAGCNFSVTTNTRGLRVWWSGAYWISGNYFGHPTYPVSSVLQTGDYVFGVDGGGYGSNIQWDTAGVVSLPGKPSVHLNY